MSNKRIQLWNSPFAQQLYLELGSARERRSFMNFLLDNTCRDVDLEALALHWQTQRRASESLIQCVDPAGTVPSRLSSRKLSFRKSGTLLNRA